MSARQVETQLTVAHPRETTDLFGHREAELALLNAYRSGRIPHAWLIGGPAGIGKATLAYRMARFVLSHRDPLASDVQRAATLHVDAADPVDLLNYAISELGHSQAELAELLGSRSRASELLNRRRPLTVEMIHRISEAWKIPADLLVRPYRVAA